MADKQSTSKKLGVLMIDFSPVIREGLQAILTKDKEITVIGDAPDEHEAIKYIKRAASLGQPVDVVLTETKSDKIDGVKVTKLIKEQFPKVAVLVLAKNTNDSYLVETILAGASGYMFIRDMSPEALLLSIHRVRQGDRQMSDEVLRAAVENLIQNSRKTLAELTTKADHLTAREVDVLRLMGNGDSNKVIAKALGITPDTTKKHVRNVIDKLQARSRAQAAIIAAQAGIVGKPIATLIEDHSARIPLPEDSVRMEGQTPQ